jgi:hypothetical protein
MNKLGKELIAEGNLRWQHDGSPLLLSLPYLKGCRILQETGWMEFLNHLNELISKWHGVAPFCSIFRLAGLLPVLAVVDEKCQNAHMEIVFYVTQESDGGLVAECLTHDIFTQADSWEELRSNVHEAVAGYFFDQAKPEKIRLHLVRDEVLAFS